MEKDEIRRQIVRLALLSGLSASFAPAQWLQTNGPCHRTVFAFAVSDTNLFAGPIGKGVCCIPLLEMITSVGIFSDVPKPFSLSQSYPNPFNPKTVVTYQLSVASNVRPVVNTFSLVRCL